MRLAAPVLCSTWYTAVLSGVSAMVTFLVVVVLIVGGVNSGRHNISDYHHHKVGWCDADVAASARAVSTRPATTTTATTTTHFLIPPRMIFTWFGAREMPAHYAANMNLTIDLYRRAWNDTDVGIELLGYRGCVRLLELYYPGLLPYFVPALGGAYLSDICRVAALYGRGGYYFDVDMLAVWPYVPEPTTTIALALCADGRHTCFSQSFIASERGHPILLESLRQMFLISTGVTKPTRGNFYGTAAMFIAHERWLAAASTTDRARRGVHMLRETHVVVGGGGVYSSWALQLPERKKRYCNYVCHDGDVLYFYSRVYGTGCGLPSRCQK
jgi:hypothetical protein